MIKLNIQRFGHTNSTSNYELPQFVGTDKPQWLTDINQAFASIDTAIHSVSVLANLNSTKIGDLTDLTTDNKIDLVSAINEVDSHTDSNTNTIAGHTTAIGANTTAIGNLTDLDTVDKTNLVSGINEVNLIAKNNEVKIGNLNNLDTEAKSNLVVSINEIVSVINKFNLNNIIVLDKTDLTGNAYGATDSITCAFNSDYSVAKIYGNLTGVTGTGYTHVYESINPVIPAGYRPTQDIVINPCGISVYSHNQDFYNKTVFLTIKSNGKISITINKGNNADVEMTTSVLPFIIFIKDFGDVPTPEQNS